MSSCNPTSRYARTGRYTVSALCVVFGVAYLLIGIAHDRLAYGLLEFAIMLAFGAALIFYRNRGSEPAALMTGETSDERYVALQLQSSATVGRVLILLIVAGLFWSLASDNQYIGVFTTLAAAGGVTSMASDFWFSRRG